MQEQQQQQSRPGARAKSWVSNMAAGALHLFLLGLWEPAAVTRCSHPSGDTLTLRIKQPAFKGVWARAPTRCPTLTPPHCPSFLPATVEMLEKIEEAATSAAPAPLQFLNRLKPPRWLFRTVACLILGGQVVGRISRGGRGAAGTKGLGVSGGVTGDGERGVDHHSVTQQLDATTIVTWQCVGLPADTQVAAELPAG